MNKRRRKKLFKAIREWENQRIAYMWENGLAPVNWITAKQLQEKLDPQPTEGDTDDRNTKVQGTRRTR